MSIEIKPLEWTTDGNWSWGSGALSGVYSVRPCLAEKWKGQWLLVLNEKRIGEFYPTASAAKAAAQKDFDARIRSAIEAEWIAWDGGHCLLAPHVKHQRKYRDGLVGEWTTGKRAGNYHWQHDGGNADIVAYRVAQESSSTAHEPVASITEDDVWLLASAAENLRGGSQNEEKRVESAWRIASKLDDLRKRLSAPPFPSPDALIERLMKALSAVKTWAEQKCPCENEQPNPCPLCGASVENLESCKAVDNTFPRHIREVLDDALRAALAAKEQQP